MVKHIAILKIKQYETIIA